MKRWLLELRVLPEPKEHPGGMIADRADQIAMDEMIAIVRLGIAVRLIEVELIGAEFRRGRLLVGSRLRVDLQAVRNGAVMATGALTGVVTGAMTGRVAIANATTSAVPR